MASLPINNSPATPTFPRHVRLRKPQQFKETFSQGHRIGATLFRLHVRLALPAQDAATPVLPGIGTPPGARLGVAVSKRVDARAVGRNRIKRLVRESFRAIRTRLPGGDYVLLAQREAANADNAQLVQALDALWLRAIALGKADPGRVNCRVKSGAIDSDVIEPEIIESDVIEPKVIESEVIESGDAALKRGPAAITMPPRDMLAAAPGRPPESH